MKSFKNANDAMKAFLVLENSSTFIIQKTFSPYERCYTVKCDTDRVPGCKSQQRPGKLRHVHEREEEQFLFWRMARTREKLNL